MKAEKLKQLLEMGHQVEVKDNDWDMQIFFWIEKEWKFVSNYSNYTEDWIQESFRDECKIVTKPHLMLKAWDKVRILENCEFKEHIWKKWIIKEVASGMYKIKIPAWYEWRVLTKYFPSRAVAPDWGVFKYKLNDIVKKYKHKKSDRITGKLDKDLTIYELINTRHPEIKSNILAIFVENSVDWEEEGEEKDWMEKAYREYQENTGWKGYDSFKEVILKHIPKK